MANRAKRREIVVAEAVPVEESAPVSPKSNRLSELLPELPDYIEDLISKFNDDNGFSKRNLTKEEKSAFCRAYVLCGNLEEAAEHIGISFPTAYNHLQRDPDFKAAVAMAKLSQGMKLQGKSVQMAMKDHGVTDRMCQLKRHFPQVYGSHNKDSGGNTYFIDIHPNSRIRRAAQP